MQEALRTLVEQGIVNAECTDVLCWTNENKAGDFKKFQYQEVSIVVATFSAMAGADNFGKCDFVLHIDPPTTIYGACISVQPCVKTIPI